jgi:MFS family permease
MGLGYGISVLARPILALAGTWGDVLTARFVDRVGKGVRTAPRDAIIAASAGKENPGLAFGFHRAMDTIGAVIGPGAAFLVLYAAPEDYRLLFWLATIPAVIAVAVIFIVISADTPAGTSRGPPISLRGFSPEVYGFVAVIAVFSIGNSSDAFLILRAQERGVPDALVPLVYLGFNVVYASLATPAGALADRIGRRRLVVMAFPLFAAVYAGFAIASEAWQVPVLFGLYGAFMAMTEGVQRAYLATLLPEDRRATGFGLFNMVVSLALLPASIIAGAMWDHVDPAAPFWFGASTALLAWALLPVLVRGR